MEFVALDDEVERDSIAARGVNVEIHAAGRISLRAKFVVDDVPRESVAKVFFKRRPGRHAAGRVADGRADFARAGFDGVWTGAGHFESQCPASTRGSRFYGNR